MYPNEYFGTFNARDEGGYSKTCKRPGGAKRYQRTNSYDETYFDKQFASLYGRPYQSYLHNSTLAMGPPTQVIPTVYCSSGLLYGAQPPHQQMANFFDQNGTVNGGGCGGGQRLLNQANKTEDVLYGNSPLAHYSANSYLGWHKGLHCLTTMPRPNRYNPKPVKSQQINSNLNFDCPQQTNFNANNGGGNFYRINKNNNANVMMDCKEPSVTNAAVTNSEHLNSPFGGSMDSAEDRTPPLRFRNSTKRNRIKLCIICSICVIIVAVLIALGVAVYSQVKSQSTGLKLVRQYRGYFLVVGGKSLEFNADLLNVETAAFKNKAQLFQTKIDAIFEESGLTGIYEGAQITAFQFVIAIPAIEVHFNVRTKVNVQLQVNELLTIFEDSIRKNLSGIFGDVAIDLSSLTIENQTLNHRKRPAVSTGTQKSLTPVQIF